MHQNQRPLSNFTKIIVDLSVILYLFLYTWLKELLKETGIPNTFVLSSKYTSIVYKQATDVCKKTTFEINQLF